jgi:hypothetical protein
MTIDDEWKGIMIISDYNRPHYVYLVGNVGINTYKIGLAMNIERRIRSLQLPFEIELITKVTIDGRGKALTVEQGLHRLYADRNIRGEWFRDIDPKTFVFHAEYIAADRYDLALEDYRPTWGQATADSVKAAKVENDLRVLAALKSGGIDAARKARGL